MNWSELEEKHMREWNAFETLKMKAWELEEKKRAAMQASFGPNEKNMPESVKETLEKSVAQWHEQWGKDGIKSKELSEIQKIERDTLKIDVKQQLYAKLNESKKQRFRSQSERDREQEQ